MKQDSMQCGMVILNYRDADRAIALANKCCNFSSINRVVIVDNCSPDGSWVKLGEARSDNIDVIKSDCNGGFSYGCNFGAKYLLTRYSPEFILFANTDTIFDESVVSACVGAFFGRDDLGLVTARMKKPNGEEQISAWPFTNYSSQLLNCFWVHRHHLALRPPVQRCFDGSHFEYVDVVRGSFMYFKAQALIDAGFFDEHTFLYGEEAIIAKRLLSAGYRAGLLTDKWYVHDHKGDEAAGVTVSQLSSLFESSYYYLSNYCQISMPQKALFRASATYGISEYKLICFLKKLVRYLAKD